MLRNLLGFAILLAVVAIVTEPSLSLTVTGTADSPPLKSEPPHDQKRHATDTHSNQSSSLLEGGPSSASIKKYTCLPPTPTIALTASPAISSTFSSSPTASDGAPLNSTATASPTTTNNTVQTATIDMNVRKKSSATSFGTKVNSLSGWWPTDEWLQNCADQQLQLPLQPFPTVGKWKGYRLGDCFKLCLACSDDDTMAGLYNRRACDENDNPNYVFGGNLTVVEDILRQHDNIEGFARPNHDELVVHLRLGDVIELSHSDVATMLTEGASARHSANFDQAKSIKSAYEYLTDIQASGLSKVTIIGGSHKPDACRKSRPYAACLKQAFEEGGYEVRMELDSGNADHDFYYMSHAKKISVSTGGYSRLIGRVAVHNGGSMIGRSFR